jgi:hypothetical protein
MLRLRDLLAAADRVLDQAVAQAERPALAAPGVPDTLLDFLQELSSARLTNDPQYAYVLARRVPSILAAFDITLLDTPDDAQRNRFALVSSLDDADTNTTGPRVVKPALVQGDVTVRRGEISR